MKIWNRLLYLLPSENDRKSKDLRNRAKLFISWAIKNGLSLEQAKLAAYRLYLLQQGYSLSSVKAHLSTIRGWMNSLIKNGQLSENILQTLPSDLSLDEQQRLVAQTIGQVREALETEKEVRKQTQPSVQNLNLSDEEVGELIRALRFDTLSQSRDSSTIAVLVTTGLRKEELVNLKCKDLHHMQAGSRAIYVSPGVGRTERYIPIQDDALWMFDIVETWLSAAGIKEGPVFRGVYKSGNMLREGKLSVSAVERLLANYPIAVRGQILTLKPLDLRHAYASHLFRSGKTNFETLKQYLGVKTNTTVLDYLGHAVNQDYRLYIPYEFDLSRLKKWSQG